MLYKRQNSTFYWCRFTAPDGRRVQQSTQTVDKLLAQEFEDRLKSEYWRVYRLGERPRHTWKEAVVQWFQEAAHKASLEADRIHLKFADRYLGDRYLDQIDRIVLEQMITDKLATGVRPATVR